MHTPRYTYTIVRRRALGQLCSVLLLLLMTGCGPSESGPSYADLVVIYNAEVEALDRLEAKRAKVQAELDALSKPTRAEKAAGKLKQLLNSAQELKNQNQDKLPSDPNSLLDSVLENSEQAEAIASGALEEITRPSDEEQAARQEKQIALRVKLAELDKEIEAQRARVEKARTQRDLAEQQR